MHADSEQPLEVLTGLRATIAAGDDRQIELNVALITAWTLLSAGRPTEALERAAFVMGADFGATWKA